MNYARNIVRMIILFLLQILLFNHLHLFGLCHPYVYIVGLLCMPLMPRWVDMLVGAVVGFTMDIACSSLGIHTMACILLTYLRPLLLAKMVQDPDRVVQDVYADSIGLGQFIRLAIILCLVHHGAVFMLDAWTFHGLGTTLLRWVISSSVSLLIILPYGLTRKS